ncbi:hypothetical protein DMENIID0001_075320 [Sergentomyia squamirostris]
MDHSEVNLDKESEKLCISFSDLWYKVNKPEKKDLLKGLTGCFRPGRLSAIMGPSGAGKTTLSNILSGFRKPSGESSLLINGTSVSDSFLRKKSSFLAQELTLLGKLTTIETLEYAADLKLPSDTSKDDKRKIIADIIKYMGLEKCINTTVEKLSGGERKRLSIGEELVTKPPIMIFDEPTSGLDSVSTVQLITYLRELAHTGLTVICVIHQPSSQVLELFDDLYVLSEGNCVYNGSVENIVPAFQEAGYQCPQYYNRADFVLEVASHQIFGDHEFLIKKAKVIDDFTYDINKIDGVTKMYTQNDNFQYPISQWKQFCILFRRIFLYNRREFIVTHMKILLCLTLGFFIGFSFYKFGNDASKTMENVSLIFILIIMTFFCNSLPLILLYPSEVKILHREYLNNWYGLLPYFYAKILAEMPSLMVCTFATMLPAYILSDQPLETYRLCLFSLIFILLTLNAFFFGMAIGIICDVKTGIFIIPATAMPMFIFCGFFIRYSEMPAVLRPLSYISYFRYMYEGAFQSIYGFNRENLNCERLFCNFEENKKFLEEMDMVQNNYVWDVIAIIIWILILKCFSYFAMKIKLKNLIH